MVLCFPSTLSDSENTFQNAYNYVCVHKYVCLYAIAYISMIILIKIIFVLIPSHFVNKITQKQTAGII